MGFCKPSFFERIRSDFSILEDAQGEITFTIKDTLLVRKGLACYHILQSRDRSELPASWAYRKTKQNLGLRVDPATPALLSQKQFRR